jgi:hypothetical protein
MQRRERPAWLWRVHLTLLPVHVQLACTASSSRRPGHGPIRTDNMPKATIAAIAASPGALDTLGRASRARDEHAPVIVRRLLDAILLLSYS